MGVIRVLFVALGGLGFAASAAIHLATFTPAAGALREGYVLFLFAAAFVPLVAMLLSLRRAAPTVRRWRRLGVVDWRSLVLAVPAGMRTLVIATASYALMNLTLSLLVAGEDAGAGGAGTIRLISGHLLLLYLIPLAYFAFAAPAPGPGRGSDTRTPGVDTR